MYFQKIFMFTRSFNSRLNLTFLVTLSLTIFFSSFRRRSFVGSFRWSIWSPNKNHGNSTGNEFHKLWYLLTQITKKIEKIDLNLLFLTTSLLSRSSLYVCFCLRLVFLPCLNLQAQIENVSFFYNWNIFLFLIGLLFFLIGIFFFSN